MGAHAGLGIPDASARPGERNKRWRHLLSVHRADITIRSRVQSTAASDDRHFLPSEFIFLSRNIFVRRREMFSRRISSAVSIRCRATCWSCVSPGRADRRNSLCDTKEDLRIHSGYETEEEPLLSRGSPSAISLEKGCDGPPFGASQMAENKVFFPSFLLGDLKGAGERKKSGPGWW